MLFSKFKRRNFLKPFLPVELAYQVNWFLPGFQRISPALFAHIGSCCGQFELVTGLILPGYLLSPTSNSDLTAVNDQFEGTSLGSLKLANLCLS